MARKRSGSHPEVLPEIRTTVVGRYGRKDFRSATVVFRRKPLRRGYPAPMARASDVFTAAQAAQVLGISERRVRQLVTEGKLPGERGNDNVVRIPQQAVNEERKRRRGTGGAKKAAPAKAGRTRKAGAEPMDVDALAERVASAVGQRIEGQLEITHRAESLLRGELDEERARRMQSEAQLQELRVELADAQERLVEARRQVTALETQLQQAQAKRGLFRR